MLNSLKKLLILMLLFLTTAPAFTQNFSITKGTISFRSDAPLELISASSNDIIGKLDTAKKIFAFIVKIKSFTGFNKPLQKEHFNENYMESNQFPHASFSGKIIEDIDFSKNGTYTVRAKGILTVHGVSQERIIKTIITINSGNIKVNSNFTVQLSDHNIPIPKVVHEKLASEISIEVTADMTSK